MNSLRLPALSGRGRARCFLRIALSGFLLVLTVPLLSTAETRQDAETQAMLKTGKAALQDGLHAMAEREFERYIRKVSNKAAKAEGVLFLARTRFGQGAFDEVIELLDKRTSWAKGTPSEDGFVYWKARALYEKSSYQEALDLIQDFGPSFPESPWLVSAFRLQGKCFMKTRQPDKAIEIFSFIDKYHPDSPEAPDNLLDWAGVLMENDREVDALEVLDRLIKAHPENDAAAVGRLWAGRIQMGRQEWVLAEELLAGLSGNDSARADRRASAWFTLAELYESRTNIPAAVNALEQGSKLSPDPVARIQGDIARGKLLIQSVKTEEGMALLRESIKAMPSTQHSARAQLDLAQILLEQGLHEKAAQEFQHYLEAFADREGEPSALMGRGWSLWGLERYGEAASAFERAYATFLGREEKALALLKAADSYFANRQFKLALDRYQRVIEEFPDSPLRSQAMFQAAECLAGQNRIQEAVAAFRALAEGKPEPAMLEEALMRAAQLMEKDGQWEEAMATYDRISGICSNRSACAMAIESRGLIRYRLGRFEEALADFERVVHEFPEKEIAEQAFYMRGWALYLLGRDEEALAICQQFIAGYPKSSWTPDVLFWLGEYHYNHGAFEEAEKQFAALADKYSQSALADDALFWAGRAAAELKEYLRAIEYYNKLTKVYPDSPKIPEARFAQGDALSELGQFAGAILAFDEIIIKFPKSYLVDLAWGRKGDCQFTLGNDDPNRYQEALLSYRTILNSAAAGRELKWQAEFKMGRCREKMGRREEALEHYMNVVYGYLADAEAGSPGSPVWFTRAAFNAAAIKESEQQWREAVNIYKRVVDANVPVSDEAQARIQRIRFDHWVLF